MLRTRPFRLLYSLFYYFFENPFCYVCKKSTTFLGAKLANAPPTKMILTTCAACAAPLADTAPRCVRCRTRYCNKTCQHDHWRRGHKQMCKKIHRGGNAEQYNADKKYKEAVAEAVEACADDAADATFDDLVQAEALLDDTYTRFRRVMGDDHPCTSEIHAALLNAREELARARASSHA